MKPSEHDGHVEHGNGHIVMRPISGPDELGLFTRLPYVLNDELADDLTAGRRRPQWMWVALARDHLLARLAWWSRTGDAPLCLDILDLDDDAPDAGFQTPECQQPECQQPDRLDVAVQLLKTAMAATLPAGSLPPQYGRFVPPDWRDSPAIRRATEDRMAVAERAGARFFVERLRLEWRQGSPVPAPSGRLVFRPVRDAGELLALMVPVLDGTLDAHSRDDLDRMPAREAATRHYESELAGYQSPREWWQVATLPGGEPVGFVIPARNAYNPIIAYIGVLPGHRGHGYVDDLLAEGTRILADQGAQRIRASTDLGNTPMAAAFRWAGYVNFEREINMVWPPTSPP